VTVLSPFVALDTVDDQLHDALRSFGQLRESLERLRTLACYPFGRAQFHMTSCDVAGHR
jgi:hypothetical protein